MSVKVITISRQFGSGGRTVGRLVAERMGWEFYDKELVRKIAAESGLAESYILESGEYACSTNSFLFSWAMNAAAGRNGSLPMSDQLFIIQNNIIRDLAAKGNCVIVGRCSDYTLRDRDDCLHTFIHADKGLPRGPHRAPLRRAHRFAREAPEGKGRQAAAPITPLHRHTGRCG